MTRRTMVESVERIVYLRSLPSLSELCRRALELIAVSARECHFRRGATLVSEGDVSTRVHFIVDGAVQIDRAGRPFATRRSRTSVGWLSTLAGVEAAYSARATSDTLTLCLDQDSVADLCEDPLHGFAILHANLRTIAAEICRAVAESPASTSAFRIVPDGLPGWRPADRSSAKPSDWVERMLHLRALPLFRDANLDGIAELARGLEETRIEPRERLWAPGEPIGAPLHVVAGCVSCRRDGQVHRFGPGTLLGFPHALASVAHEGTVVADTEVLALRANAEHLLDVIEDNTDIGLEALGALARQRLTLIDDERDSVATASGSRTRS
jgi:CRP-like cAMP-binding protein